MESRLVHVPSEVIAEILPSRGDGLLGDKMFSVVFDNTKVKRLVPEFVCTIPFPEGVRMSLRWFDEHPDSKVVDPDIEAEIEQVLQVWNKGRGG